MSALPKLSVFDLNSSQSPASPSSESIEMSSSDSDNQIQNRQQLKPQLPTQLPPIQCCSARNPKKMNLTINGTSSLHRNENSDINQSAASSPKSPVKERQCSFLPQIPLMVIPANPGKSARSLLNRNRCNNTAKKYKGNINSVVLPPMQDSIYSNINVSEKENGNELAPLEIPPAEHYMNNDGITK